MYRTEFVAARRGRMSSLCHVGLSFAERLANKRCLQVQSCEAVCPPQHVRWLALHCVFQGLLGLAWLIFIA